MVGWAGFYFDIALLVWFRVTVACVRVVERARYAVPLLGYDDITPDRLGTTFHASNT